MSMFQYFLECDWELHVLFHIQQWCCASKLINKYW